MPALDDALSASQGREGQAGQEGPDRTDPKDQKEPDAAAEDLVDLFALVPEPASTDPAAAGWKQATAALAKAGDRLQRVFINRRVASARERVEPAADDPQGELLQRRQRLPARPIEPQ